VLTQTGRDFKPGSEQAGERLARERDLLQAVMNGAKNAHLVYLDRDFNFVRVNEAYAGTCGYRPEEMIGKNHFALYPHPENEAIFRRARDTGTAVEYQDKPFVFPDQPERGVTYWDWTLIPVKDAAGQVTGLVFSLIETTARKRAEQALRRAKEEWERTFDAVPDMIAILDDKHRILRANRAMAERLGCAPEECVGRVCYECVHGKTAPPPFCPHLRTMADGQGHVAEIHEERLGGDFVVSTTPLFDERGERVGAVHVARDVTERKKREDELRRLNRTLTALSHSNQALMRAENEMDFLNEACRIIVEDCGHAMVWIGYAMHDEAKSVRPVAYAGFESGYLETLRITWADTERGQGPTGTAIRTGQPCACANMFTDPRFAPWREEALKRGYASSIVLPLRANGKTFGAVTIYFRQPGALSDDELRLLTELADDVAHGVAAIRLREAHARAEEALREARDKLEQRVAERTAELRAANEELKRALAERRRLEAEILQISNRERQRIGQDLHDGLTQQLNGILYLGETLREKLMEHVKIKPAELARMTTLLADAVSQARSLAHGLNPVGTEPDGLVVALKRFANLVRSTFQIVCRLECQPPVLVEDNNVATHLYRIAQEAVQNAIKHGGATRVTMRLREADNRITLEVRDNGVGLANQPEAHSGMGLHIMQYRAGVCGGHLSLRPGPRGGAWVTCSVPRPAAPEKGTTP
jgi:PAS domain S-box-containing protein